MRIAVLGGAESYALPFTRMGGRYTRIISEADIIVYAGGTDVHPSMYQAVPLYPESHYDLQRDKSEKGFFNRFPEKIHVGICRGSQFLAAMSGFPLIQHIEGHLGGHKVRCLKGRDRKNYDVTSTHHQVVAMSVVNPCALVRAVIPGDEGAIEAWSSGNVLGIQWHPEYATVTSDSQVLFEKLLLDHINR